MARDVIDQYEQELALDERNLGEALKRGAEIEAGKLRKRCCASRRRVRCGCGGSGRSCILATPVGVHDAERATDATVDMAAATREKARVSGLDDAAAEAGGEAVQEVCARRRR